MATTSEALGAGGRERRVHPLVVSRARTARRILADRIASRVVVLGGLVVIASILAILVVIVGEILPLFRGARADFLGVRPVAGARPAAGAAVGSDEYREIGYEITADGAVRFTTLRQGDERSLAPFTVGGLDGAAVTTVASDGKGRHLLGTSDGRVVPVDVKFEVAFGRDRRTVTPAAQASPAAVIDADRRAIRALAFATPSSGPLTVAQVGPRDLVVSTVVEKKALIGASRKEESIQQIALPIDDEVTALAADARGEELFAGTSRGRLLRVDLREGMSATPAEAVSVSTRPGAAITALGFLLGDRTLVVGDAGGGVGTWQVVAPGDRGEKRLSAIHRFDAHSGPVIAVTASRRDKGFATADASGRVHLSYGTTGRTLLTLQLPAALRSVAFAPKADGLVALANSGALAQWRVDNPHPEVTLRTLFGRVWYEGYPRPEYVWQSTGGTDDFEAKLSLTPLVFGTLKGTLYALLFAVPLALLAAVYVSEFMHPRVKGVVKPVVEIMAALPSVVLGFLAGLWLAPRVERVVPGLFLAPVVIAGCALIALALWQLAPAEWRRRQRPGSELLALAPAVLVGVWLAFLLGGLVEHAFMGDNYRGWLLSAFGLTYDQRNSLVVGIAMGFAVIPIIFTIAEDSLANVPQHLRAGSLALGATRWQTAVRVVLPTASPGIFSAIMIGFGRAVGETMIVLMATGNTPVMDWSIFNGFRALSANIAVELPEAPEGGTLFRVLFLAAFLLFCLTFAVNTVAELVRLRLRARYRYL